MYGEFRRVGCCVVGQPQAAQAGRLTLRTHQLRVICCRLADGLCGAAVGACSPGRHRKRASWESPVCSPASGHELPAPGGGGGEGPVTGLGTGCPYRFRPVLVWCSPGAGPAIHRGSTRANPGARCRPRTGAGRSAGIPVGVVRAGLGLPRESGPEPRKNRLGLPGTGGRMLRGDGSGWSHAGHQGEPRQPAAGWPTAPPRGSRWRRGPPAPDASRFRCRPDSARAPARRRTDHPGRTDRARCPRVRCG